MSDAPSSSLEIPVSGATTVEAEGGQVTPYAIPDTQLARATQSRLDFQVPQGTQVTVRRVHASFPILLQALTPEESEATFEASSTYETEQEAAEAAHGKGGKPRATIKVDLGSYNSPYVQSEEAFNVAVEIEQKKVVRTQTTLKTKTSILPLTLSAIVAITGPDGPLWGNAFDVNIHRITGGLTPLGAGLLGEYIDLTNPLVLDPNRQVYGLQLALFIPAASPIKSLIRPGGEYDSKTSSYKESQGSISIFYDQESINPGK